MLEIGTTLRRFRDNHKYSQQQAANIIGISRIAYRRWENNEIDFSISQLRIIAEIYEISIEEIIKKSY